MNMAKKAGGHDSGALSKIKKLQAEMEEYSKEAVAEALAQAEDAIATLASLGQRYRLVRASGRGKGMRQTNPDRPCPVCQFKTDPPHDARQHRGQGKSKRAFTASQLTELGLKKA